MAVLMHCGYYNQTICHGGGIAEIRAHILLLPPQKGYASCARNNIRSRAWGEAKEGCSYQVGLVRMRLDDDHHDSCTTDECGVGGRTFQLGRPEALQSLVLGFNRKHHWSPGDLCEFHSIAASELRTLNASAPDFGLGFSDDAQT